MEKSKNHRHAGSSRLPNTKTVEPEKKDILPVLKPGIYVMERKEGLTTLTRTRDSFPNFVQFNDENGPLPLNEEPSD